MLNSAIEYCSYNSKTGGSIDRLYFAMCLKKELQQRLENIKTDAKNLNLNIHFSFDKQEISRKAYLSEEEKLTQNVQKVLNNTDKEIKESYTYDNMIITYLMEDKKKAYQQHIADWKNFVLNYCSYQGSEFVCLNDLYKAKNKSVQQDYKNYE